MYGPMRISGTARMARGIRKAKKGHLNLWSDEAILLKPPGYGLGASLKMMERGYGFMPRL